MVPATTKMLPSLVLWRQRVLSGGDRGKGSREEWGEEQVKIHWGTLSNQVVRNLIGEDCEITFAITQF